MIYGCRYRIWLAWRKIVHRPVLSILLILIFIYIGATSTIMVYERVGFGTATLEIFPAFFGEVGFIESPYLGVQISIILGMLVSITFLAIITAKITSVLVEFVRR